MSFSQDIVRSEEFLSPSLFPPCLYAQCAAKPCSATSCISRDRIWTSNGVLSGPRTVVCSELYPLDLGLEM